MVVPAVMVATAALALAAHLAALVAMGVRVVSLRLLPSWPVLVARQAVTPAPAAMAAWAALVPAVVRVALVERVVQVPVGVSAGRLLP